MVKPTRLELLDILEQQIMQVSKGMVTQRMTIDSCDLSPALDHVLIIIGLLGVGNVKQIAQILQITSGAATQHITALEADGLCERRTNPADRRETLVELTKPGQVVIRQLQIKRRQMLETVFSDLDNAELSTLVRITSKVSQKYNQEVKTV